MKKKDKGNNLDHQVLSITKNLTSKRSIINRKNVYLTNETINSK